MDAFKQRFTVGAGINLRRVMLCVVAQALKPASFFEESAVKVLVPVPGKANFLKSLVVGRAVAVPLGVG